jgi:hypothetical protein
MRSRGFGLEFLTAPPFSRGAAFLSAQHQKDIEKIVNRYSMARIMRVCLACRRTRPYVGAGNQEEAYMADIDILVRSTPSGTVKIWARNQANGRVCYGGLSGSTRGLKIGDSLVTARAKERKGYVRAFTVIDTHFGTVDNFDLKEIVGGVSRALTENANAIPWDCMEAKIARYLSKGGVGREHLARLINPRGFGFQPSLMIRNLNSLSIDDDDDTPIWFVPNLQIASAVTVTDANWNF